MAEFEDISLLFDIPALGDDAADAFSFGVVGEDECPVPLMIEADVKFSGIAAGG